MKLILFCVFVILAVNLFVYFLTPKCPKCGSRNVSHTTDDFGIDIYHCKHCEHKFSLGSSYENQDENSTEN